LLTVADIAGRISFQTRDQWPYSTVAKLLATKSESRLQEPESDEGVASTMLNPDIKLF